MPAPSVPTPRGLQAIYATLKQIYPDQPNPLQVTALVKYWLVYLQVNHVVTYALTGSQYWDVTFHRGRSNFFFHLLHLLPPPLRVARFSKGELGVLIP